jgi:hypothetical protein
MQALRNILIKFTPARQTAVLVFLGLSGFYLSLSPASIAGQGYTGEELNSGLRMLAVIDAWMKGHPAPSMVWSRHGPIPVLFDLPFIKLGEIFVSPDFMLSFQPVLLTGVIVAVLYLWLRKLCSPGMSLLLTMSGALGTMLWPYAYISLETKQTLFVLLAGYLALATGEIRRWPRAMFFAAICGLAITVKSTGIVLFPAIAYLVYVQFRDDWRSRRGQLLTVFSVIGAIWVIGAVSRNYYWGPKGGGFNNLRTWLTDSPFQLFTNAIGLFGSPTKGLFVYAPVLLMTLYAIPQAFRTHRPAVIYTLLAVGGTLALLAPLTTPVDETWGPRYFHTSVPLLLLCVGAAWPRFRWRRGLPLLGLAALGLLISFLGAFYYYGVQDIAAARSGQNTMEWITGDTDWNHVTFNARLFRIWRKGGIGPVLWIPKHTWVWHPPAGAQEWKSVDLRELCQPQSFMVRFWNAPKPGVVLVVFRMYVASLLLGMFFLTWAVVRTLRERQIATTGEFAAVRECGGSSKCEDL